MYLDIFKRKIENNIIKGKIKITYIIGSNWNLISKKNSSGTRKKHIDAVVIQEAPSPIILELKLIPQLLQLSFNLTIPSNT